MNAVVPQTHVQLPAAFAGRALPSNQDLREGLPDSYAVLAGRGKQFLIKYRQVETPVRTPEGHNVSFLDVVLVKVAPQISKIYYAGAFQPGDDGPPDCFSVDGMTPDPAAKTKQATSCAGCPHNVFGSKITPQGTAVKACGDSRRLALVPASDILNQNYGGPMMFRVPPASLKNLAHYASELDKHGLPYFAVVTRISFDPQVSYDQYLFQAVAMLDEAQAAQLVSVMDLPVVDRMLSAVGSPVAAPVVAAPTAPTAIPQQPRPLPSVFNPTPPAVPQPQQMAPPPAALPLVTAQPIVPVTMQAPVSGPPSAPVPPTPVLDPATGQWVLPAQPTPATPVPPTPVLDAATGQWVLPAQPTPAPAVAAPAAPAARAATSRRSRGRPAAAPAPIATPASPPQQAAPAPVAVPMATTGAPLGSAVEFATPAPAPANQTPAAMINVTPAPADVAALVGNLLKQ